LATLAGASTVKAALVTASARAARPWPGRGRAGAAPVGDQDLLDPLDMRLERCAETQRTPLPEAGEGDRRGATVEGRRDLGVERLRIDQDRP
jgi:hypothetical protein